MKLHVRKCVFLSVSHIGFAISSLYSDRNIGVIMQLESSLTSMSWFTGQCKAFTRSAFIAGGLVPLSLSQTKG